MYALHFDPEPVNSDSVEVKVSFLNMNYLKDQDAAGVASALTESMNEIAMPECDIDKHFQLSGVVPFNKLIGFTSDGASVNRGQRNSVKVILRENAPWLVFIWCVAHRLELAIADALSGTDFDSHVLTV